jgi:glycosyltransferase involved in cell wall biosynthesis
VARAWTAEHPDVALVVLRGPAGALAARSVALAHARGELALVLAAGVELHPPALDRLVAALEGAAPDVTRVWPIVELRRGDGPARLRGQHAAVDAPVLWRTRALRDAGAAADDARGTLVAQVLAVDRRGPSAS